MASHQTFSDNEESTTDLSIKQQRKHLLSEHAATILADMKNGVLNVAQFHPDCYEQGEQDPQFQKMWNNLQFNLVTIAGVITYNAINISTTLETISNGKISRKKGPLKLKVPGFTSKISSQGISYDLEVADAKTSISNNANKATAKKEYVDKHRVAKGITLNIPEFPYTNEETVEKPFVSYFFELLDTKVADYLATLTVEDFNSIVIDKQAKTKFAKAEGNSEKILHDYIKPMFFTSDEKLEERKKAFKDDSKNKGKDFNHTNAAFVKFRAKKDDSRGSKKSGLTSLIFPSGKLFVSTKQPNSQGRMVSQWINILDKTNPLDMQEAETGKFKPYAKLISLVREPADYIAILHVNNYYVGAYKSGEYFTSCKCLVEQAYFYKRSSRTMVLESPLDTVCAPEDDDDDDDEQTSSRKPSPVVKEGAEGSDASDSEEEKEKLKSRKQQSKPKAKAPITESSDEEASSSEEEEVKSHQKKKTSSKITAKKVEQKVEQPPPVKAKKSSKSSKQKKPPQSDEEAENSEEE